jgi:molybdopterin-containing oxidoreductase family iron-sulfur binding subunit
LESGIAAELLGLSSMKTIPPPCPEPETGIRYWRSLDQLAETPEFRQWVEREFPAGASELTDPVNRRDFVKLMSASFLLAGVGLTGCRRPESIIYPFSKAQEGYIHGVPKYYATAMPTRESAVPLLAKWNDGRPTKLEGNPEHPDSNGATDTFAQASILNLYDPDRALQFSRSGNMVQREEALAFLTQLSRDAQGVGGQGLAFLMERSSSPSRRRVQGLLAQKYPQARWFVHEPVDFGIHQQAASQVFGKPVSPYFKLDAAKVIVSLDCDFIGSEPDTYIHCRRFARGRRVEKPTDSMNRLYVAEALMTLTGSNADHRLRVPASIITGVAARLAMEVLEKSGQSNLATAMRSLTGAARDHEAWIVRCAEDLLANRGQVLVLAGYRQPLVVHMLAQAINSALGAVGKTVVFRDAPVANEGTLSQLVQALNAGQVQNLVVLGSNPAYTAPADLNWPAAQTKAKTVVRLGYYEDESSTGVSWHLPLAHFLESWGDARTSDGTLVPVQPLIEPLFGGLTELEVLARIGGLDETTPYDILRTTFRSLAGDDDEKWKRFLHDGYLANSSLPAVDVPLNAANVALAIGSTPNVPAPTADRLEVLFYRDYSVDDGRYSNNGWLQEMPDPITKITWDNAVLMSRVTASAKGLRNGDVIAIEQGGRRIEGPVWVQPGMADNCLGLALGYGRERAGRVGKKAGFNAYPLRTSQAPYAAAGAVVTKAPGQTYHLSCTQNHWSMEGRPIVREATLQQYAATPDFAKKLRMEEPPVVSSLYPNPLKEAEKAAHHQWGMSIDLNACVGCAACMIACQSENNIPIVGKKMVAMGREMHWIRIDRYFAGDPKREKNKDTTAPDSQEQFEEWIDDPQVVHQPMLCQHCEAAPCENVCPVNATVHDQEGLNLMVYNRCVGTRYCSNNCPYKVRRFNYFDYNKRPLDKLLLGPLAKRPQEEYDLIKLIKNPDVTVRMRGVMEKCTFCVQRIEAAKIAQKVKAGASGDVQVPEGSFTTACAQACPADAIVFGNVADANSRVSKLKQQERDYTVLEFLYTRPRLTYMAKVRNPNPNMPDAYKAPLTFEEYTQQAGENPLEEAAGEHGAARGEGAKPAEKGAR